MFRIIAIACLAVFYGCYILKMIRQKNQGIQTDQMGKGKTGFVKFVEVTLKLAAILVLAAELVSIYLGSSRFPFAIRILGAVLSIAGTAVFIISVMTMKDSWRAGISISDRTELVTDGIYRFSRNPAFLGFDLLYIGILLMFFNWILFFVTVFAILMYHLQIVDVEEDYLQQEFGNAYLQYRKTVCRYLGRKHRY